MTHRPRIRTGVPTESSQSKLSAVTLKSLNAVIRRIVDRCFQDGDYRQVVGIAVEAHSFDILREAIMKAGNDGEKSGKGRARDRSGREELMDYLLDICMDIIGERSVRNSILQLILDMLTANQLPSPDYLSIAKCMVYLDQHSGVSKMLRHLVEKDDATSLAVAYQVSFDLYDNGTQDFRTRVVEGLPELEEPKSEFSQANGHATEPNQGEDAQASDPLLSQLEEQGTGTSTIPSRTKESAPSAEHRKIYGAIRGILTGTKSIELSLEFMYRTNKSDRKILTKLKSSLEARHSIFHSAVNFANAFTNCGTTSDWFIRENLDWLGKAVNWSKFSVTASLGVIHKGNLGQGMKLLEPYLRDTPTGQSSAYSKGGALFALGLIYTNHGKHVLNYLHNRLKDAGSEEVVQHGAALGLGVAGMATESEEVVEELKGALFSESAISGQATGLAMGLVMLGSANVKSIHDMVTYAHETQHEKTVRGLALGIALIMYARQEAADDLITGLLDDPDPVLRYGGVWTIALAYCGTSSNKAVRRLLHVAVSDVNDDVRRTAVMSLGFILFKKPESVPRMVELLAESYNPHVRYGACMALGIACAGTGLEEAVDLLEPLMKDTTDFVRQGALIALSMILIQVSEAMNPKTVTIRKHLQTVISDRHEDAMAKFGAALSLGIIDAGGRNCTIGLQTQTGNLNMAAIVGMAVFTQYWYWFPLTHFISLTFTPTTVIGLNTDLEIPELKLHCNTRPTMYDYPPAMAIKAEETPEKVKTAVLSTTAQAKRRKLAKAKQDGMDIDPTPPTPKPAGDEDKMETDEPATKDQAEKLTEDAKASEKSAEDGKPAEDGNMDEKEDKDDKEKEEDQAPGKAIKAKLEKEKVGYDIDNLSRVLPAQIRYLSFPADSRYSPVKKVRNSINRVDITLTGGQSTGGVVLLIDNKPSEPKVLMERQVKKSNQPGRAAANAAAAVAAEPATPAPRAEPEATLATGGADAASVLNAVDEDEEGVEEAQLPRSFDYYSDDEEDES